MRKRLRRTKPVLELWRPLPYPSQSKKLTAVTYRRCLCTYVDVLGFREMVKQSAQSDDARSRIHFILQTFPQSYSSSPGVLGDEIRTEPYRIIRNFSDLIIRIIPLTDRILYKDGSSRLQEASEQIVHEGIDLCGAQFHLFANGILVRGGMTIGDIYWDDNEVFGPALVHAYDLERNLAHYPRIVIDPEVIGHLSRKNDKPNPPFTWHTYFRQDFDGMWFADYLGFIVAQAHPRMIHNKEGYRPQFEKFRHSLMSNLKNETSNINIRAKHLWMAKYFNSVIDDAPEGSGIDWSGLTILT